MKKKFFLKYLISIMSIFFISVCILLISILSSCANSYEPSDKYEKYIREREVSVRFTSTVQNNKINNTFGTMWIVKKSDDLSNFSYYMATNMHVISPVISIDKNKIGSKNASDYFFSNVNKINFGIPSDIDNNNSSLISVPVYDRSNNQINQYPEISYMGFIKDLDFNFNDLYFSKNYNDKILCNLPLIDFCILKFDFSNIVKNNDQFKQYLENYDLNPTKFSKYIASGSRLHVGGYSKIKNNLDFGDWTFTSQPCSNRLSYFPRYNTANIFPSYDLCNISYDEKLFLINNASYLNCGNNFFLINDKEILHSGSSGSMVINESFEVVGIHWGSSKTSLGSYLSVFNPLFSFDYDYKAYKYLPNKNFVLETFNLKSYDLIDDIINKLI